MVQEEFLTKFARNWEPFNMPTRISAKNIVQGNDGAVEFADNVLSSTSNSWKLIKLDDAIELLPPFKKGIPQIDFPAEDFFEETNELISCQRMKKNGQVYQSLNYVRKNNSAGYLVQFKVPGVEQPSFGEIHCFIKAGRVGHAVVNVLSNSNINVCQGERAQSKDFVVKEFLSSGVLGYHFFGVKRTRNFKIIRCDQISTRGIFVKSSNDAFVDAWLCFSNS